MFVYICAFGCLLEGWRERERDKDRERERERQRQRQRQRQWIKREADR